MKYKQVVSAMALALSLGCDTRNNTNLNIKLDTSSLAPDFSQRSLELGVYCGADDRFIETEPKNGLRRTERVDVSSSPVEKMEFYADGDLADTVLDSTDVQCYNFRYKPEAKEGAHTYHAVAYDAAGNTAKSNVVNATYKDGFWFDSARLRQDKSNPDVDVEYLSCSNRQFFAMVMDDKSSKSSGLRFVRVFQDGNLKETKDYMPGRFFLGLVNIDLASGTHRYSLEAEDWAGNTARSESIECTKP